MNWFMGDWMDALINGWIYGWTEEQKVYWMAGCSDRLTDGCMHAPVSEWMD